jgi:hypothetical protein
MNNLRRYVQGALLSIFAVSAMIFQLHLKLVRAYYVSLFAEIIGNNTDCILQAEYVSLCGHIKNREKYSIFIFNGFLHACSSIFKLPY